MPSERVQRQIERLLDQAEEASTQRDWNAVLELVSGALALDAENTDAVSFKQMAEQALAASGTNTVDGPPRESQTAPLKPAEFVQGSYVDARPTSFAAGRYAVSKFLGEGGKKQVYLAHDNTLDRDVAFALIKTEGLDETSRERVKREAQAMGRMGTHPCIMPIYDLGEEVVGTSTQPYMVQPLMSGGDVEGLIEDADGPLELERAIEIATQTAQGLSFAHGKGIVHRDLKPGNVWLDEDGSAKIGDFGLAVATDRSRLTVEKVMVGTVSYMPPEQATGGEVTPQADLYSLGAMLYEMSTGRVPFMGDDDIAVISQHINTPPVAPSWHNSQIPKTLDSLILRLLSKDPAERPASADEVLAALDAVDPTAVEEREEQAQGSLDSMAGGVFVGRQREMDQLKSIFEEVLSGRGRMVTLVGEPGIGKTRTAQELATYAGMRGANVLWGRSYESGGAPPYWPWVQTIRSYVAETEPQVLREQLGATATVIAEVVSDIKAKLADIPTPTPIEDPESARFRLFDSISTFLKNTASTTPLVLMLEDLHWSDRPSLTLLEFVARELSNSRILIVGNYRDMELNRRHPLSVTLGDLSRERLFERVVLRGLQKHDVQRFIEIAAGIAPPSALVDAVHSQTEGNPLFVTETVRLLIQEGDISSGQSSKGGTTSWEIRIPEGVREVIGRRLDRLSERCNEVLTIAAVIGRQFRFDVLKMLTEDTTDNQLLDAMDEALSARIIEELPDEVGFYQFTHAQMQETLIGELSHTRAVRMHAQIAEALEEYYGDDAEEHATELVEHFAEAETVLGSERLVRYCAVAGNRALASLAISEAEQYFRQAVDSSENKETELFADILVGLGNSVRMGASPARRQEAIEVWNDAIDIYLQLGKREMAARVPATPIANMGLSGYLELIDRGLAIVEPGSLLEGHLLARSAIWYYSEGGDVKTGLAKLDKADEIAKANGDKTLQARATAYRGQAMLFDGQSEQAARLLAEAFNLGSSHRDQSTVISAGYFGSGAYLREGDPESARKMLEAIGAVFGGSMPPGMERRYKFIEGRHAFLVGNLQEAQAAWSDAEAFEETDDARLLNPWIVCQMECNSASASMIENAWTHSEKLDNFYVTLPWTLAASDYCFFTGDRSRIKGFAALCRESADTSKTEYGRFTRELVAAYAEAVAGIDIDALDHLKKSDKVSDVHGLEYESLRSENRLLAVIAARSGDSALAEEQFEKSDTFLRRAGYKPELARTCCDYSEFLLDRNAPGDREKAIELQDEAISIATELGMKPLLERLLAKREILKA